MEGTGFEDMNGILILEEYVDSLRKLSNEDLGALIQALFADERGEDPGTKECSLMVQVLYPIIKSSMERVKKVSEVRAEAGRLGGRPKANEKQTESKIKQTESKPEANEKQNEANGKQTESPYHTIPYHTIPDNKERRFTPPTTEDVADYAAEKGIDIDAQRFVDFYASKGWKVGSSPMKDWRAAVRNWAARDRTEKPRQPSKDAPVFNFDQRHTDYEAVMDSIGW